MVSRPILQIIFFFFDLEGWILESLFLLNIHVWSNIYHAPFPPTLFTIDSGSFSSRNAALVVPSSAVSAPPPVTLLVCGAAAFLILCLAFSSSVPQCSLSKLCVIRCCWLLKTFLTRPLFFFCLFVCFLIRESASRCVFLCKCDVESW